VKIDIAAPNVAPRVIHRRWRMFALIVGTLLSLLIPLLASYFGSCADIQGPFEQTAATIGLEHH
jgi:hypothetical protein